MEIRGGWKKFGESENDRKKEGENEEERKREKKGRISSSDQEKRRNDFGVRIISLFRFLFPSLPSPSISRKVSITVLLFLHSR